MRAREKIPHPGTYRRSLLQNYTTCPRRTRFSLQTGDRTTGYVGASADLGLALHLTVHRIMKALHAQGHPQMATQEAVEIMYEVLADGGFVLGAEEYDELRWMTLGFCRYEWSTKRIMAMEDLLWQDIVCQDGKTRTFTGRPDLLLYDGQAGIVIVDYKSGKGKPRTPRKQVEGEVIQGKEYLSERGHFQLDGYGYLALKKWPKAEYATLRELHLRSGEIREATLGRAELEHVERQLGNLMQTVDQAITAGPKSDLWRPRPGRHCVRTCPVAQSCPVPREQRGDGAVETPVQAREAAKAFMVVQAQGKQLREQLKAYHEQTGEPVPLPDGSEIRWEPAVGPGRSFGVHWPAENRNGAS